MQQHYENATMFPHSCWLFGSSKICLCSCFAKLMQGIHQIKAVNKILSYYRGQKVIVQLLTTIAAGIKCCLNKFSFNSSGKFKLNLGSYNASISKRFLQQQLTIWIHPLLTIWLDCIAGCWRRQCQTCWRM